MRKRILLVSIIATMGLGAFLVSCSDDDDNSKYPTCKCELDWGDGDTETFTVNLSDEDDMDEADLEVGDIKNCKELASYIEDESGAYDVSCKVK